MSGTCKDEMKKLAAKRQPLDLEKAKAKLATLTGKQYWRHLEELAETEEFQEMLHREFPRHASVWNDGVSRRNFLQLMGASMVMAGLAGCTKQPPENIIPYVRQPEEIIPGKPLWFATAMPLADRTIPLIAKSDMGRPIKVEGNPDHPAGSMATDSFSQACLWDEYDPDRSQTITELGEARSWEVFQAAFTEWLTKWKANRGAGIYFLTGASTSPTLASQMDAILKLLPEARWHMYEAVNHDNARAGAQMALGQVVETQYKLENADIILSFDCDFLSSSNNPDFLRNAWAYGQRRKAENGDRMNRMYVVESTLSPTGAKSDHRVPAKASEIGKIAQAIAARLGVGGGPADTTHAKFVDGVVNDLQAHRGASVIMAGETQPAEVHALCHAMNQALGNAGKTVVYSDPVMITPPGWKSNLDSIAALAADINAGKVQTLFIWNCNPCVTAPDDLNFRHTDDPEHKDDGRPYKRYSILEKVPFIIHLGNYQDESATVSHWHINEAHFLESWGDGRTPDGTVTLQQPLIEPLYGGKTIYEVLGQFTDHPSYTSHEWVKNYWQSKHAGADFESFWRRSVHDGFMPDTALPPRTVTAKTAAVNMPSSPNGGVELVFRPDHNIFDGRFANNAWLQELPRPITMITWDNAVLVSLNSAHKWGFGSGDLVEVDHNGRKLVAAAWVTPGQPDDSITMHVGYGRNQAGRSGNNHGFNTYLLRTTDSPIVATGLKPPVKVEGTHNLAAVHLHHNVDFFEHSGDQEEARGVLRSATLEEFKKNPNFAQERFENPNRAFTLYKPSQHPYDSKATPHAWGMVIDLNSCIGCNTCMVACRVENNIPVVGQWEVLRGREMHWIRIDNYYLGDYSNPQTSFQPVPCMQCENAPCEVVCPVGATVHSSEGLNDMVYNRCVGTRYCSNNCPYKVRRFNFMLYADYESEQAKLRNNPDVTVRSRGVMEKCTYCIQRITRSRIEAEEAQVQGRGDGVIPDGALSHDPASLKTACQQSCPSDAIVFGNINDPKSRVNQWRAQSRNYGMLAELNTQPRTTYLAEVRNPNPELGEA